VQRQWYQSAPGAAHFEDGTVDYLNLPAIEIGLNLLDRIGMETIHARVGALGSLRTGCFCNPGAGEVALRSPVRGWSEASSARA
jgi:kynureninase